LELAQATHQPVLTGEVTPTETQMELEQTPVVETTPENKEVELAEVFEPTTAAPAPASKPETPPASIETATLAQEPELPHTASPFPLIALLGMGSFGLAWL